MCKPQFCAGLTKELSNAAAFIIFSASCDLEKLWWGEEAQLVEIKQCRREVLLSPRGFSMSETGDWTAYECNLPRPLR